MNRKDGRAGLHKRVFGSMLFFLGALQIFFLYKAHTSISPFQMIIAGAGAILFIYGTIEAWAESD